MLLIIPLSVGFSATVCKRFALRYRTVVCVSVLSVLSCPVCDVGVLWPNRWMDQDETWRAGRPQPWIRYIRWRPSFPPQRSTAPNFGPISTVAKWLDGSRCHLV